MAFCVIDTETSGLFDFSLPADAPGQPRLASLSMITVSDDLETVFEKHRFLVRPDGWRISDEAARINGLTHEMLMEQGQPIDEVLDAYQAAVIAGHIIGAFNAQFDTKVMRAELRRAGRPDLFEQTPNVCAMRAAAKVIPVEGRRGGRRMISLAAACEYFGITNAFPHEAQSDALACLELMRVLARMGALPEPSVHYAKNRPAA